MNTYHLSTNDPDENDSDYVSGSEEEVLLESDDSGSEFDPEGDAVDSDALDELDDEDEDVMVDAAVQQSLRTAREERERRSHQ